MTGRSIAAVAVAALALSQAACDSWGGAAARQRSEAGGGVARAGSTPGAPLDSAGLAAMIDALVPEISKASGLPVQHPVAYALQSRSDARAFIDAQLDEDMGPEELRGTERVYRALGLIPDTMDLRVLLLELYAEQVVGYYDPKSDRLYVLAGVAADSAAPVVAHELVHALQDQYTDLDSLVSRERGNDRQMAAQAAAEGQATLVMAALQTARATGKRVDPGTLPDMRGLLRPAIEGHNDRYPVFQRAPRIIRETLIFPYMGGAVFVQALFRHRRGDDIPIPFGDLLPQSTEQVLRPVDRFIDSRDAPTTLYLGAPGDGWSVAYANDFGELETSIILDEYLGDEAAADGSPRAAGARRNGEGARPGAAGAPRNGEGARPGAAGVDFARGWDGDRYALLDGPDGRQALVWYSVWDDDASADRFATDYRRVLAARPGRAGTVDRMTVKGRPVVRVVETPAGGDPATVLAPALIRLDEGA